jgi:hypothetical protein
MPAVVASFDGFLGLILFCPTALSLRGALVDAHEEVLEKLPVPRSTSGCGYETVVTGVCPPGNRRQVASWRVYERGGRGGSAAFAPPASPSPGVVSQIEWDQSEDHRDRLAE